MVAVKGYTVGADEMAEVELMRALENSAEMVAELGRSSLAEMIARADGAAPIARRSPAELAARVRAAREHATRLQAQLAEFDRRWAGFEAVAQHWQWRGDR